MGEKRPGGRGGGVAEDGASLRIEAGNDGCADATALLCSALLDSSRLSGEHPRKYGVSSGGSYIVPTSWRNAVTKRQRPGWAGPSEPARNNAPLGSGDGEEGHNLKLPRTEGPPFRQQKPLT